MATLFVTIFLPLFLLPLPGQTATVSPGSPSAFTVETPSSVKAGSNFTVTITVLDDEGNRVRDYGELDRTLLLSTTGDGELSRDTVNSKQFDDGRATVDLSYTGAEDIQVLVNEQDNIASGRSDRFTVRAAEISKFKVSVPDQARAGQEFSVQLQAYDQFDNPVRNYVDQTNGVSLKTTGLEKPDPEFLPADDFEDGQLRTLLTYTVAESTRLVVIDESNGVRTVSDTINVRPGRLADFTLSVPKTAQAGKSFRTAIEARDRFGNIVENYAEIGEGVTLSVPSGGTPDPSYVSPDQFENGVAFVEVSYNQASPIRLRVRDSRSSVEGRSSEIKITPAKLDHFSVKVPEQVQAGKEFSVEIKALDNFGNTLKNYTERGEPVRISVRGSTDTLRTVEPSVFEDGVATVKYRVTRTGKNRLRVASAANERLSGLSQIITVGPGPPGQIRIDLPESARAGNNFTALLVLQDQFGNVIRQPGFLDGEIRVSLVNHSKDDEKTFDPEQFINGRKRVVFSHNRAEEVSVFTEYRDYDIRNTSQSVEILPGEFDQIAVNSPGSVRAGSSFNLNFTLLDQYGNKLREVPERFSSLELEGTGSGNVDPAVISSDQLSAPTFQVPVTYYVAESMSVKILDSTGRQLGISAPIQFSAGPLDNFNIRTPDRVSADEKFKLRLEANDAYQNTVKNLDKQEGTVNLETSTEANIDRNTVQFGEFANGVAEVGLEYHRAGELQITAQAGDVENQSGVIQVKPGSPSRYEVLTEESIQAGEPFPAVIEVYDQYGNSVTEMPDDFYGVELKSKSQLSVHPSRIEASLFDNGEANVFLAVTGTGNLSLTAVPLEEPLDRPEVDRFFLSRDADTATLSVFASGNIAGRTEVVQNAPSGRIEISMEPADLLVEGRTLEFDNWFLNSISQTQTDVGDLPIVGLNIYPNKSVNLKRQQRQNLLQFIFVKETVASSATLREIQRLIQEEEYEKANKLLEKYLQDNPDDQDALQLRLRLKRLRDVVDS